MPQPFSFKLWNFRVDEVDEWVKVGGVDRLRR
jgi:hypothetical protein